MEKDEQLNLYQKVQKIRVELQEMNLKKSGLNKYAGFKYYELGDFLPELNKLSEKYGVCNCISFDTEVATLTIYDADTSGREILKFTSPMKEMELKGCNAIQALGGVETYSRRYLYLTAYEIVENDLSDAVAGQTKANESKTKPQKSNPALVKKLEGMLTESDRTVTLEKYKISSIEQLPDKILQKLIARKQEKQK